MPSRHSLSRRVSFYSSDGRNDAQRTLERVIIAAPLHDYVNERTGTTCCASTRLVTELSHRRCRHRPGAVRVRCLAGCSIFRNVQYPLVRGTIRKCSLEMRHDSGRNTALVMEPQAPLSLLMRV